MAWVYKRGSRWWLGWRDPTGKLRSKSLGKHKRTEHQAQQYLKEFERQGLDADLGLADPKKRRMTVREFVDDVWLPRRTGLRTKTVKLQATALNKHILPVLGEKPLRAVRTEDVEDLIAKIVNKGRRTMARRTLEIVNTLLGDALRWDYIRTNPAKGVEVKLDRAPTRTLSIDEIARVIEATPTYWRPFTLTAALTGCRWGELCALQWRDVNMGAGLLRIERQHPSNTGEVTVPKSAQGIRTVSLLEPVKEALWDLDARRVSANGEAPDPNALVFTTPGGTTVHHRNFARKVWYPARKKAKLPTLHFHHLRHYAGTLRIYLSRGDLMGAAAELGHYSPALTASIYAHELREVQRGQEFDQEAVFARLRTAYRAAEPAPEPKALAAVEA